MSEKVNVENLDRSDPYDFGVISYKVIADHVFTDLALAGALQAVRILIDIRKPLFYIRGELNVIESPIRFSEITSVTRENGEIHVVIEDETYAPEILKLLWTRFGRENISQTDRWNLYFPHDYILIEELNQLIAVNPRDRIMNKILDALNRIIPEGFRVQQRSIKGGYITVIASENPIEEEWLEEVNIALKNPPVKIPAAQLEKLKREPKKSDKKIVPWKTHKFQESIK